MDAEAPSVIGDNAITALRALEALRAGVPNRESVLALGTKQQKVVDSYLKNLEETSRRATWQNAERAVGGLLIAGGFGSGKSHLIEYLAQLALRENFVVSKVVISKETPLYNIPSVYRAAINDARVPGRPGSAVHEVAISLRPDSIRFSQLYRWLETEGKFLDHRLIATLRMFEQYSSGDEEFTDRILQFWAGGKLGISEIRKRLREAGWLGEYNIKSSREDLLCKDRFSFFSRLVVAAGYSGWVLLIDEVELVGRYSLLQRARSYAEVSGWLDGSHQDPGAPLTAVLTTVDDFENEVLIHRDDMNKVPAKLLAHRSMEWQQMVGSVRRGMELLSQKQMQLDPPSGEELDMTYRAIKAIHAEAFNWSPPDVEGIERLPSNRMRQYVRSWINEWDLVYLDPSYAPSTVVMPVEIDLAADANEISDISAY